MLSPADNIYHIDKTKFDVPFVCGAKNLGEALRRIAEGATMASEAFLLGVPYLYLNPLMVGYIDYQCTHYSNRCFKTTNGDEALKIVNQLMDIKIDGEAERRKVEEQTINPTDYLVKFVEDFR